MGRFLHELRRRNVFRLAAGYLAVAWVSFEVISGVKNAAGLPVWVDSVALIILAAAFPVVLYVAWTFELTPDGIRATPRADAEEGDAPMSPRPLDYVMMGAIILFAGLLAWQPISRTIRTGAPPLAQQGEEVNIVSSAETPETELANAANEAQEGNDLTVAVLPFLAMSSHEDDGYFADGLTEEILNSLAAVPELRVTSRTSAFQFRGTELPPIPEIASSLGVAHVLEGSVRRSGEQVRITAQLIRASDDVHLWSQTYDRSLEDVFAIQEDIAENVAGVLQIVLREDNRRQMRNSGTRNIDAFIAFQRAKELWDRAHDEDSLYPLLAEADALFSSAVELAPDFSEAYLLQSDRYAHILAEPPLAEEGVSAEMIASAAERQSALLQRAFDTATTDTRRAIVEANQIFFSEDWSYARDPIEDVLTSDECANDNWLQDFARIYDNMEHRLAYAERQVRCDPLNPAARLLFGNTVLDSGDYEAALAWADDLEARGMNYESEIIRFDALLGLGRLDDAEAFLQPHWEWEELRLAAMRGGTEAETILRPYATDENTWFDMLMFAFLGERDAANAIAAEIDARPYGYIDLITAIDSCRCGAPFDIDATPEFAARYAQTRFAWPPAGDLGFPLVSPVTGD